MKIYRQGDILLPSKRIDKMNWLNGLFHPAIVWGDFYEIDRDFSGIMLTHSPPSDQFVNIPMAPDHFEPGYEIGFSDTFFVNQLFVKFQRWGLFELVGRLTEEGIEFIENHLDKNTSPIEFTHYRQLMII